MTGQSISTASGYATAYDAGVPLQSDPADIVQAFQEYHYGPGYTGSGSPTSGMEYHLGRKLDSSNPVGTGTLSINSSTSQILLKNAAAVTKGTITTNTGVITGSAADDLSLNTTGSKILLGINGTEKVGITSAGASVTGNLSVSGTAAFTGNVTAPTQSISDNTTKVATTAYVTSKTQYFVDTNTLQVSEIKAYQTMGFQEYATEIFQPQGNSTVVTQFGSTATTSTGTAVNIISKTTARTLSTSPYKEITYTSAAAGTPAGIRGSALQYSVENTFQFYCVVLPSTARPSTAVRFFMGMTGSTAATPNANLNTLLNAVGIGYDSTDTEYSWYLNDGTGVGTKTTTGIAIGLFDVVEIMIWADGINIYAKVRITTSLGTPYISLLSVSSGVTDTPQTNALLSWRAEIVPTAAVSYSMNVRRMVMRTPDPYATMVYDPVYPFSVFSPY